MTLGNWNALENSSGIGSFATTRIRTPWTLSHWRWSLHRQHCHTCCREPPSPGSWSEREDLRCAICCWCRWDSWTAAWQRVRLQNFQEWEKGNCLWETSQLWMATWEVWTSWRCSRSDQPLQKSSQHSDIPHPALLRHHCILNSGLQMTCTINHFLAASFIMWKNCILHNWYQKIACYCTWQHESWYLMGNFLICWAPCLTRKSCSRSYQRCSSE